MKYESQNDSIVALATPKGYGAISIVRMSGDQSVSILKKVFNPKERLKRSVPGKVFRGYITARNHGRDVVIDNVLVNYFKKPHSYTGEDVVEIYCHGNPQIVDGIIRELLGKGTRLANPGEFTKRAFLNGKLDLAQAEAVADVINAQTKGGLKMAIQQLYGNLTDALEEIKEALKEQCVILEHELDFIEDEEIVDKQSFLEKLENIIEKISRLIKSFEYGKIVREGVNTVIVGRPNVGKSSLMNYFLNEERVIVSEIPGTTRDSIEESFNLQGYLFKIADTAGIRNKADAVEAYGIERTKRIMQNADLLVIMFDGSEAINEDDLQIVNECKKLSGKEFLFVINKNDLDVKISMKKVEEIAESFHTKALSVSVKMGIGLETLKQTFVRSIVKKMPGNNDLIINKIRHRDAMIRALGSLKKAKSSLRQNLSAEFIALDLRLSLNYIGEISGEVTSEDILNEIFSTFCVGK